MYIAWMEALKMGTYKFYDFYKAVFNPIQALICSWVPTARYGHWVRVKSKGLEGLRVLYSNVSLPIPDYLMYMPFVFILYKFFLMEV